MPGIIAESSGYPYTNVAIYKPTWQTSTVIDADGHAARAVDGSRNPIYVHGSCTHTYTEDYPSWAVDLGYVSPISMVNVTNRQGGLCMEIIHYTPLFWIVAFIVNSWLMWYIHSSGLLHWPLTHCDRVTHMWVGNLTNIGTDNGLSPGRNQAIIWTNVGILSIRPLGTNLSKIVFKIHKFWIKKMHLKRSSANGGHFFSASMCLLDIDITVTWVTLKCTIQKQNKNKNAYTVYIIFEVHMLFLLDLSLIHYKSFSVLLKLFLHN